MIAEEEKNGPGTDAPQSGGAPARPRIMILTSSTGGGHDSRSYSLKTWLEQTAPCEVRVEHMLEDSSPLLRFGVWIYNTIQKRAPGLHNIYWFVAELFARTQGQKLSVGRKYYLEKLSAFRPHLVISMHDCLNRGYFQEAAALLGDAVRTCTYCGEWSGGFGYSLNWIEKSADLFISRTEDARKFAEQHEIRHDKSEVFCNLLPPRAFAPPMSESARRAYRENLGLRPDHFTVLMAAGAAGANNHARLLDRLASIPGTQAIAFCGKSERARTRIEEWKAAHPDYPLFVEGFSTRVHKLLQASDCVVSRGGANTTAEALYHGCPILFNLLGGVMPQERLTLKYFIGHGAALPFSSANGFAKIVRDLSSDTETLGNLRKNLRDLHRDDRPESLAARLLELAADAVAMEGAAK